MTFQPGKSGNPEGRRKEQRFRKALALALGEGKDPTAKLRRIAEQLVKAAEKGEPWAIKEVADREDGKPAQALIHQGDEENPLQVKHDAINAFTSAIAGLTAAEDETKPNGHARTGGNGISKP